MLYHLITFKSCTFFEIFISNLLVTISKKVPKKLKKMHFSKKFPDFFPIFSIFSYGLNHIFVFFGLTCYHKKMRKKGLQKKHKKMGKNVFKILFYFSKMDKNKCPKKFLKKKFQKTGIFCFFHSYIFL